MKVGAWIELGCMVGMYVHSINRRPGGPMAKTHTPNAGAQVPSLVKGLDPTCGN